MFELVTILVIMSRIEILIDSQELALRDSLGIVCYV